MGVAVLWGAFALIDRLRGLGEAATWPGALASVLLLVPVVLAGAAINELRVGGVGVPADIAAAADASTVRTPTGPVEADAAIVDPFKTKPTPIVDPFKAPAKADFIAEGCPAGFVRDPTLGGGCNLPQLAKQNVATAARADQVYATRELAGAVADELEDREQQSAGGRR